MSSPDLNIVELFVLTRSERHNITNSWNNDAAEVVVKVSNWIALSSPQQVCWSAAWTDRLLIMKEGLNVFHQHLVEAHSVLHAVAAISQRKSRLFLRLFCGFFQGFFFFFRAGKDTESRAVSVSVSVSPWMDLSSAPLAVLHHRSVKFDFLMLVFLHFYNVEWVSLSPTKRMKYLKHTTIGS